MPDSVIFVENLSKSYTVGHQSASRESYTALRDVIAREARNFTRKTLDLVRGRQIVQGDEVEEFWALRDVSFEVKRGDVLGIIGRNGAGKSTLLKILSRITEPTRGRVVIRGRVASLLEVGTGFHPELTGRENIYLNGAILGMTQQEIRKKFDEIVAFADVEQFLDTPVKRYSSGMYVRLAFSVAAHLEPEILLVDEVLAVGDAPFQRKCLGKIGAFASKGRTVLFVTHQLDMVRALCQQCILLSEGRVLLTGSSTEAIDTYLSRENGRQPSSSFEYKRDYKIPLQVTRGRVVDSAGKDEDCFDVFDRIVVILDYFAHKRLEGSVVNFELKRNEQTIFLSFDTDLNPERLITREIGKYRTRIEVPCPLLKPGKYSLTVHTGIANSAIFQRLDNALTFEVTLLSQPSSVISYAEKRPGLVVAPLHWQTKRTADG